VIRNNQEHFNFSKVLNSWVAVFQKERDKKSSEKAVPKEAFSLPSTEPTFESKKPHLTADSDSNPSIQEDLPTEKKEEPEFVHSETSEATPFKILLPKIVCPLKTEPLLFVILKVQIIYTGTDLKKEFKFREQDVRGVIQNLVYQTQRVDLKADILRKKIMDGLSDLLKVGQIKDVVFKDFKIEIRKK